MDRFSTVSTIAVAAMGLFFLLMFVLIITDEFRKLNKKLQSISREAKKEIEKATEEKEYEKKRADTLERRNEQFVAVYENVTNAMIDKEELMIKLERAVSTICSICIVGADQTGSSCAGCYWDEVNNEIIKPYRRKIAVDEATESQFKVETQEQNKPEELDKEADDILSVLYEKSCANCWKSEDCDKLIGSSFVQDDKGNCLNWESEEKRDCQNCALLKFYEEEREKIEKGREFDDLSDEEKKAVLDIDCYESASPFSVNAYYCKNWVCKNWVREGEDNDGRNEQGELSPIVQAQVAVPEAGVQDREEQGSEHPSAEALDRTDEASGSSSEED